MEVVGYECYANGTIKLKIMPVKESKRYRKSEEEFYGSGVVAVGKRKVAKKATIPFQKEKNIT